MSAANSAARKRSRPSGSAGQDSRVSEGGFDAPIDEQAPANGRANVAVNGHPGQDARDELAVVPAQDIPGDLAVADLEDADDLDDEAVDLEDFEDLEDDLGDALAADLAIADSPEADLPDVADVGDTDDTDADDTEAATPGEDPEGAAQAEATPAGSGASGDDEIFVFGDDDDDLPAAQVAVAGATADPV
ncbi:MAG TPA: hypothetical protein VKG80_06080, partial [Trebonia sp.]|nr:hypothetical protein [Trebonia sp.]